MKSTDTDERYNRIKREIGLIYMGEIGMPDGYKANTIVRYNK